MATSATPDLPPSSAVDQRWRRAGAGAGSLIAGRVIAAACGFIQVPIVFRSLGTEGLGIWIALTGWLWSATILDGGLGFAVQNRLTRLLAAENSSAAGAVARKALCNLVGIGGAVLLIGLPIARFGHWASWFGVRSSSLGEQIPAAVIVVIVGAALIVPLSLATRIATAVQATWITGLWTTIASVAGLGAILVAAHRGSSLASFVAAGSILPIAPHAITWLHVRQRVDWAASNSEAGASLWRESALFLMPQLGAALIGTLVPTLVTLFAGPIAAATFGVLQRLYGFALQIQAMGLTPTWPAYTHAAAVGDAAFARRTFRVTWLVTGFAFIVPTLALTPLVPAVVRIWLGLAAPSIPATLLWLMAVWYALQFCGQQIAMLLNGLGRLRSMVVAGWIGIVVTLGLCFMLGPSLGAPGVLLALAIPYAALNLPVTGWQACRALRELPVRIPAAP